MIRPATEADVPAIVAMGVRFIEDPAYAGLLTPNTAALEHVTRFLMANPIGFVAVADVEDGRLVGMIGAVVAPHPLTAERMVQELCWWVEPEYRQSRHGLGLLRALEDWTVEQGAVALTMMAPVTAHGPDVARLYAARSYRRIEEAWQRRFDDHAVRTA